MKKLICLFAIGCLISLGIQAQEETAKTKFYAGIVAEEIDGDLEKAIKIYQEILQTEKDDRQISAKCLYHIGLCYDKMESDKAMDYFVDLLEKYPDQADMASLARNQITKLDDANTFIDPRDGHKYKWVKIGNQVWMAENLAFMPWVNPPKKQKYGIWVYDYEGDLLAEAKTAGNYQKYGCLYDWPTAMGIESKYLEEPWDGDTINHQGFCPPGWHLPTDGEWKILEKQLEIQYNIVNETYQGRGRERKINNKFLTPVGGYIKTSYDWSSDGEGNNSSGLSVLPAGYHSVGYSQPGKLFDELGYVANFWTSSQGDSLSEYNSDVTNGAWNRELTGRESPYYDEKNHISRDTYPKADGHSVRCIKNQNGEVKMSPVNNILLSRNKLLSPKVLWSISKSKPIYAPIVSDGMLLFTCADSFLYAYNYQNQKEMWKIKVQYSRQNHPFAIPIEDHTIFSVRGEVISIHSRTGEINWRYPTSDRFKTICTDGSQVYVAEYGGSGSRNQDSCKIFSLSQETGNLLWEIKIKEQITTIPATNGELIVFGTSQDRRNSNDKSYCIALNCSTGQEVWRYETNKSILSDPFIYDSLTVFGCNDNYVYAINNLTGRKHKRYSINGTVYGDPIVDNGTIYIGGMNQSFYAFDLSSGQEKWRFTNYDINGGFNEGSVIVKDQVVTGTNHGNLYGINFNTGNPKWRFNLSPGFYCHPFIYEDKIIVTSTDGIIYILEPPEN